MAHYIFQVNLIVIRPTAQALVAWTFANYAIKPFFPNCESPELAIRLLAALCISKSKYQILCKVCHFANKINPDHVSLRIVPLDIKGCICHLKVADTPFHIQGGRYIFNISVALTC